MTRVHFSNEVRLKCPEVRVGLVRANVEVSRINPNLWSIIETYTEERSNEMEMADVAKLETILQSRVAYKAFGKDPSRYRLSADALLRRVIKGSGLYQVNNVVDVINYVSLRTGFSIGGYDAAKIEGEDIQLGVGHPEEPYDAIGRGTLNIVSLPILRDSKGAFGSPTSDSTRTAITLETKEIVLVVFDFQCNKLLSPTCEMLQEHLEKYASGRNATIDIRSNQG